MTPEEARELCSYNAWADRQVLEACAGLTAEQFTRTVVSSFPSVRDTLVHIMGGEWVWLARWRGNPSPRDEMEKEFATNRFPDLASVRARWEGVEANLLAFAQELTPADLDKIFEVKRHEFALRSLLVHLVNHGTYHRGQVTTMLRQFGVTPRATDYGFYLISLAGGPHA